MEQQPPKPVRKLSQEVNVQENIPQAPSKDNRSMGEDIHEALELLALKAQSLPRESFSRKRALNELVSKIQKSGRLYSKHKYSNPDIYDEAIQETWVYIFRRIDQYDPAQGKVITWVNTILEYRCIDELRKKKRTEHDSLDKPKYEDGNISKVDMISDDIQSATLGEELVDYIEEDPQGIFTTAHVKNHPEANFRAIVLFIVEGYTWREISEKWNIPIPTLSRFFVRQIKKFIQQGRFDGWNID
ncbi:MAG TPA: sigma-70 family RNA polymerase sigma factor [Nostocaceae cyanobacterium]|nr:sigma-70 family RNA polymerase sigma factor [Nostocaceae cyanobacterium]